MQAAVTLAGDHLRLTALRRELAAADVGLTPVGPRRLYATPRKESNYVEKLVPSGDARISMPAAGRAPRSDNSRGNCCRSTGPGHAPCTKSGQLAEAERIYRQILAHDPGNPDALHLLGTLALQANQFPAAIELIGQAIRGNRTEPAFYANLAEAYRHHKMPREAIDSYRKAHQAVRRPAQGAGQVGHVARAQKGKPAEAEAVLREAVRMRPTDRAATQLGDLLQSQNRLGDAEACFRRVLRESPLRHKRAFQSGHSTASAGQGRRRGCLLSHGACHPARPRRCSQQPGHDPAITGRFAGGIRAL